MCVVSEYELDKITQGYFMKNGVLLRKWRLPNVSATEDCSVVYQIIMPKSYRSKVLKLVHEILILIRHVTKW